MERTTKEIRKDFHGEYEEAVQMFNEAMNRHADAVNDVERTRIAYENAMENLGEAGERVNDYREIVANKLEGYRSP